MQMNPFLFGSRERRLFGVYHPALGRRKRRGAVLCQPLGREYNRSHRGCRLLAEQLASDGLDVLRFDYYGTGDSAGEGEEVTLEGCVADTVTAVGELATLAGVKDLCAIGLRIGGAIALSASAQSMEINRVVLWDPMTDGPSYMDHLLAQSMYPCPSMDHAAGFPLPAKLQGELRSIRPDNLPPGARHNFLIVSEELSQHRILLEHMQNTGQVEYSLRPNSAVWLDDAELGVGAVPVTIIEGIRDWLG